MVLFMFLIHFLCHFCGEAARSPRESEFRQVFFFWHMHFSPWLHEGRSSYATVLLYGCAKILSISAFKFCNLEVFLPSSYVLPNCVSKLFTKYFARFFIAGYSLQVCYCQSYCCKALDFEQ